jgi:hypothetical protein
MERNAASAFAASSVIVLAVVLLLFTAQLLRLTPPSLPARPPLQDFLWTYRGIDVLIQAFLIFASASAVATLFRVEKAPGAREEAVLEERLEAT